MSNFRRAARACVGSPRVLIVLSLVAPLTGCGGSSGDPIASKPPAEILAASKAASLDAASVHIRSSALLGRLSLTTDLELATDGGRAKLSFLGLGYEVIRIGNDLYIKGSPAFYRRVFRGSGMHVPQGTWLEASSDAGKLARFAGLTDLISKLDLLFRSVGPLTKGATTTIDGRSAIELNETAKLFTGSFVIATSGPPYPIEIVKHGRETGLTTFSGWNKAVSLSPPTDAIELSRLEHQRS